MVYLQYSLRIDQSKTTASRRGRHQRFVEFQSLERINWSLLCPRATSVRIVVPATVVREMDKHKRSTGRRRRRAFEFNKLLQVIEDGDGTNARLQNEFVELSLTLMERFARSELEEGKLSFEVADDLIVAEAVKSQRFLLTRCFLPMTVMPGEPHARWECLSPGR